MECNASMVPVKIGTSLFAEAESKRSQLMRIRGGLSRFICFTLLFAAAGLPARIFSQSAPSIVLNSVIHLNPSTVALQETVSASNAPAQYWLVCGTSPQSMKAATPKGISLVESSTVTSTVTGLKPNTTYYFQLFASNASGSAVSSIQSFTTGSYEVRAALPEGKAVSTNAAAASRSVQPVKW